MLDLDRISDQAPPFMGKTVYLLRQLKAAGEPITLSVNGRGHLSIQDDESYQLLLDLVDRLELTEVLRERLADLDAGRPMLSMEEAKERIRAKYGISI